MSAPLKDKTTSDQPEAGDASDLIQKRYAVGYTPHVRALIETDPDGPVAKQYTPQNQELKILPEEDADPIGDEAHSPVKGIVHRYPDRVLFKPVSVCAVYCRYCFRREKIGPKEGLLSAGECEAALSYIRENKEIWEVILTGGDPLVLSARRLNEITQELAKMDHVKVLRLHSRIPIADPARITPAMIKVLKAEGLASYLVVHINHKNEITQDVRNALKALHEAGINLLSQSVLLKGINNDANILSDLFRELVTLNVKPYYLHHPDLAPGTSHFRLPIQEGQSIMRALLGHLSGIAIPTYMLDIPGGMGKIPLTPNYLEAIETGGYMLEDYLGRAHIYAPQTEKSA